MFTVFLFVGYLYKDHLDRKNLEKLTRPSNFLKTKGYFHKDALERFDDALYQGCNSTTLSRLHFEEPSYIDDDSRFGGTQINSNQAIVVKGVHDMKYFSLTALDDEESVFDTFVPEANEPFAFVVLRSKSVQKKLRKTLKGHKQFYVFIGDSYPFSSLVSVVAEKINGDSSETRLASEKCTLIGIYPQITTEVDKVETHDEITDFDEKKFETFLQGFFYKNHSIEKKISLSPIKGKFGHSLRQISESLEFNKKTYINLMTTKTESEKLQTGLLDENNRVVTSTELGSYTRESESCDGESVVEIKIKPKVEGKYKFFSASFSDLYIKKPLSVTFVGTDCNK